MINNQMKSRYATRDEWNVHILDQEAARFWVAGKVRKVWGWILGWKLLLNSNLFVWRAISWRISCNSGFFTITPPFFHFLFHTLYMWPYATMRFQILYCMFLSFVFIKNFTQKDKKHDFHCEKDKNIREF